MPWESLRDKYQKAEPNQQRSRQNRFSPEILHSGYQRSCNRCQTQPDSLSNPSDAAPHHAADRVVARTVRKLIHRKRSADQECASTAHYERFRHVSCHRGERKNRQNCEKEKIGDENCCLKESRTESKSIRHAQKKIPHKHRAANRRYHEQEFLSQQTASRNRPREPVLLHPGYRVQVYDCGGQKHTAENRKPRQHLRQHRKRLIFAGYPQPRFHERRHPVERRDRQNKSPRQFPILLEYMPNHFPPPFFTLGRRVPPAPTS